MATCALPSIDAACAWWAYLVASNIETIRARGGSHWWEEAAEMIPPTAADQRLLRLALKIPSKGEENANCDRSAP